MRPEEPVEEAAEAAQDTTWRERRRKAGAWSARKAWQMWRAAEQRKNLLAALLISASAVAATTAYQTLSERVTRVEQAPVSTVQADLVALERRVAALRALLPAPVASPGPSPRDGAQGSPGADGAPGQPGSDGEDGGDGADGSPGPAGPSGPAGFDGANGDPGEPGPAGAEGPAGSEGAPGPAGPAGEPGAPGADGADGQPGPAGADGQDGVDGQDGQDGAQGPPGPAGSQGPVGPQGPAGTPTVVTTPDPTTEQRLSQAEQDIRELQDRATSDEEDIRILRDDVDDLALRVDDLSVRISNEVQARIAEDTRLAALEAADRRHLPLTALLGNVSCDGTLRRVFNGTTRLSGDGYTHRITGTLTEANPPSPFAPLQWRIEWRSNQNQQVRSNGTFTDGNAVDYGFPGNSEFIGHEARIQCSRPALLQNVLYTVLRTGAVR